MNIELTDFTKELVSMLVNDIDNIEEKHRNDEIIVISIEDTLHYFLSVFFNDDKSYKFCREDFIGQTLYSGHLVRAFGEDNSIFYTVKEEIKSKKQCKDNYVEYDPLIWQVCLYKDKTFCKMRTYKVTPDGDISAIQGIAEKYYKISDTIDSEVFLLGEIEHDPKFVLGKDSLRRIISSNFKVHKKGDFHKIPIIVNITVDKNGKAILNGIAKSSNDIEIDNEALRVAELICNYDFTPASHRGEKVNAVYPIIFLKGDVIP